MTETPTKAENPSTESLPDRLIAGAVWACSTADEWADTLSPRRIKKLYEAADAMREAAALLAQRSKP